MAGWRLTDVSRKVGESPWGKQLKYIVQRSEWREDGGSGIKSDGLESERLGVSFMGPVLLMAVREDYVSPPADLCSTIICGNGCIGMGEFKHSLFPSDNPLWHQFGIHVSRNVRFWLFLFCAHPADLGNNSPPAGTFCILSGTGCGEMPTEFSRNLSGETYELQLESFLSTYKLFLDLALAG